MLGRLSLRVSEANEAISPIVSETAAPKTGSQ
jgi:hypothetical protein